MHKFRAEAKRQAWYDDEPIDGTCKFNNWNPFRKIHQRNRALVDEEQNDAARIATNRSENVITTGAERERRTQALQDHTTPHHANTMPTSYNPTPFIPPPIARNSHSDPITKDIAYDDGRGEKSQDSGSGTSNTAIETPTNTSDETPTDGIRRRPRKGFWQKVHNKKADIDESEFPRHKRASGFLEKDTKKYTFMSQLRATFLNSWINVLLIFVPIGIAVAHAGGVSPVGVFVINFIAIIPLAAMLSYATEEIALRVGETLGGLLNATFGNAVELIVSVLALTKDQIDIVQESLIGSMLSNLLLVMGMAFFLGGITRVKQYFNVTVAQTASSLLALAVGSLIIPATFLEFAPGTDEVKSGLDTKLSRGTAILLLVVYACYILFQLKTHASLFNTPSQKVEKRSENSRIAESGAVTKAFAAHGANISATTGGPATQEIPTRQPEEEPEEPELSKWVALLTLAISTALVAICAEAMTGSIDAITIPEDGSESEVSRTFVGLILLPIVGNAAEHATAVTVACKDKMDLAIGVAIGSSMQIALLLIPFMVVLGWIIGKDEMNLAFDGFQVILLFVSILLVNYLIQDGESHWLEGVLLVILYLIIAVAAWFYPPRPEDAVRAAARMVKS